MAEIVREGSKEEEGLRPGLEDYRWLQGRACDIFPIALVPSWKWHERRWRGKTASDMSQELSSCKENQNQIWDHFQNNSEESQTTFLSGAVPTFCSSISNCEHPTGPYRALGTSFTRGRRHPQVFKHPWNFPAPKVIIFMIQIMNSKKKNIHQSTRNRNNPCASKTKTFITSFPLVFDLEHWNGLDSFCLTQAKFPLWIKGWVWIQWMDYLSHKKSEPDYMVI